MENDIVGVIVGVFLLLIFGCKFLFRFVGGVLKFWRVILVVFRCGSSSGEVILVIVLDDL